jgi:glutathione S-transferase
MLAYAQVEAATSHIALLYTKPYIQSANCQQRFDMKLYYAPGACSLSPHVVAREAGLAVALERVELGRHPHRTETGEDFAAINPKGYVPVLRLDDGQLLSEGAAIVQYLADLAPASGLAPKPGTFEHYRLQEWLTFIGTELHKMFSPWLFHPEYGELAAETARAKIAKRFATLDLHLASRAYLLGETFTVADAYLFTIVRWSQLKDIELSPFEGLNRFMQRVAARPKVREAMRAEGLL